MLTETESRILEAIQNHVLREGRSPTLAEIGLSSGIRSKGTVHRYLNALIEKGYLNRSDGAWRGIELIQAPQRAYTLPLVGRIAAGQPIEAIPDHEVLDIGELLLGDGRFALRVEGDSMIEAGIFDGDWLVIREQSTADEGDIVVALIDHHEATLKRYFRRDDEVVLMPENSELTPMHYAAERVTIQGVLIRSIRVFS